MVHEKVIYTDGHEVMVTGSVFQVKKGEYLLRGITKHGLQKISPRRWPVLAMILIGLVLIVAGSYRLLPDAWFNELRFYDIVLPASLVIMLTGGLIMVTGVLTLGLMKERYAIRIETAEGEKDVVISTQQEYIRQINDALNSVLGMKRAARMKTA